VCCSWSSASACPRNAYLSSTETLIVNLDTGTFFQNQIKIVDTDPRCDFFFDFLPLKKDVKVPTKSIEQMNFFLKLVFCCHLEGH
jgi:hypothetical protein